MSERLRWIEKWSLQPDGDPFDTGNAELLPVICRGKAAMLKIALSPEEVSGNVLLAKWPGMAEVYCAEGPAVVMARAHDPEKLYRFSQTGADAKATSIICDCVEKLHAADVPAQGLIPLNERFKDLFVRESPDPLIAMAAQTAHEMIADPIDLRPLHGDIHHRNILEFPNGEWRAIDPKGLIGESGFDYANLLCNPDRETALVNFDERLQTIVQCAEIQRTRLLKWVLAWAGLSWCWHQKGGTDASAVSAIAARAVDELQH